MRTIYSFLICVAAVAALAPVFDIEARGGRGGGSGGGRGGGRGSAGGRSNQSFNRTPSMSRADRPSQNSRNRSNYNRQATARPNQGQIQNRPNVQNAQNRPQMNNAQKIQNRPQLNNVQNAQVRPAQQNRVNTGQRDFSRSQMNQYLQQGRSAQVDKQALRQRQQTFSTNRAQRDLANSQLADRVSNQLQRNNPGYNNWFNSNFYQRHDLTPNWDAGANLWRAARWNTAANWLSWGAAYPYYYDDYGYAIPYEEEPTTVAVQQTAPAPSTTQVSENPASAWLPLGVFSLSKDSNNAGMSNMIVQLALNKNSDLAGTYYNTNLDKAYDLDGFVDKESQQAVWKLSDNPNSPIVKTGLYNLTQESTPVTIRFPNGNEQIWLLTRLKE